MKKVLLETSATIVCVVSLIGCGGGSSSSSSATAADPTATASATATPTASATATATTTATATATAGATATATPASGAGTGGAEAGEDTGGAQAGDESGIHVPVGVTVGAGRIRATRDAVDAFLPLRFTVRNALDRELQVVVVRSGEGGGAVGRATLPANGTATIDVAGLRPGSLEVLSPDLDPDMTAIVRVERASASG